MLGALVVVRVRAVVVELRIVLAIVEAIVERLLPSVVVFVCWILHLHSSK